MHRAEVVLFDQALGAAQQRNLERHLGVAVADRTMLILEIFADRAQSHEGKLQVELARLQYLSTRLVRRWSHLERQRGGIGNRGGPGEAQIELDRRMIGERIKSVKERLEKVKRQRNTQRKSRERSETFRVSLVGYTNAGKSTLFNAWSRRAPTLPTSCSPRWTPPRARCIWRRRAEMCRFPTPWVHSRPAAQIGRSLRSHAAGGRAGRSAVACR
jgi:GTP-binding protein HflX